VGAIPASVVTVTKHSVPGRAQGIATGPDGNVWFTQPQDVQIGRITPAGVVTEDDVPAGNSTPVGMAAGADGNLWFTEYNNHKIGKITPAGAITEYPVPTAGSRPDQITTGPDGKMWFTHSAPTRSARPPPAVSSTRSARQSNWPGRRVASSIRPTGIRPSRTSTTNWDAGHRFELVS
jgi:streptogramin lyase